MSCLKQGCLLAGGILGVAMTLAATAALSAFVQVRTEKVEKRAVRREIPPPAAEAPPGRVVLDLERAEVRIKAGKPGEPPRVKATFDTNSFDLVDEFSTEADGTWVWRVAFHQTSAAILTPFALAMGGNRPRLKIYLPERLTFHLDANLREGGYELDLGGLALVSADIAFSAGDFELELRDPPRAPLEALSIRCRTGSFDVSRLGGAGLRRLQASFSFGEVDLDLRGDWTASADIRLDCDVATGRIRLPIGIALRGVEEWFGPQPASEPGAPVLSFAIDSSMSELEIVK